MKQTHTLHVWGDFACFTRSEFKVERLSYDVMTPSAARAIFECILWKRDDYQNPAFQWVIDRIDVLNPIKFIGVKRNEVKQGASVGKLFFREDHNTPRSALILKDVAYLIQAHMEFSPAVLKHNPLAPVKYNEMFIRRSTKGQSISQPYLGCREFSCHYERIDNPDGFQRQPLNKDLGFMFYDWNYKDNMQAQFFKANLNDGSLHVPHPNSQGIMS